MHLKYFSKFVGLECWRVMLIISHIFNALLISVYYLPLIIEIT